MFLLTKLFKKDCRPSKGDELSGMKCSETEGVQNLSYYPLRSVTQELHYARPP